MVCYTGMRLMPSLALQPPPPYEKSKHPYMYTKLSESCEHCDLDPLSEVKWGCLGFPFPNHSWLSRLICHQVAESACLGVFQQHKLTGQPSVLPDDNLLTFKGLAMLRYYIIWMIIHEAFKLRLGYWTFCSSEM